MWHIRRADGENLCVRQQTELRCWANASPQKLLSGRQLAQAQCRCCILSRELGMTEPQCERAHLTREGTGATFRALGRPGGLQ
jgi:hypothetical protein